MSQIAKNLFYTENHEWIQKDGDKVLIGISDHAQHSLGDIVFLNLPEPGDDVIAGEPFCDIESVKAVSDIYSPVTGIISAVNEALNEHPELINQNCYEAWICEVEEISEQLNLLSPAEYERFLSKGE